MPDPITPIPAGTSDPAANPVIPPVVTDPISSAPGAPAPEAVAPGPEDQATLDKRLKGAISEVERTNADLAKAVDVQIAIVQENPELIHKIAGADPRMANRIIEKLWGEHGIKTYKHLRERIELEGLKEENPTAYESKKELTQIKERLDAREEKDRKIILNRFLDERGIQNNEYDPNFKRLQESLGVLNPSIVAEDYGKALGMAHSLGFPQGATAPGAEPPTMNYGSGQPANLPTSKPQITPQSSWLAGQFKQKGFKMASF